MRKTLTDLLFVGPILFCICAYGQTKEVGVEGHWRLTEVLCSSGAPVSQAVKDIKDHVVRLFKSGTALSGADLNPNCELTKSANYEISGNSILFTNKESLLYGQGCGNKNGSVGKEPDEKETFSLTASVLKLTSISNSGNDCPKGDSVTEVYKRVTPEEYYSALANVK